MSRLVAGLVVAVIALAAAVVVSATDGHGLVAGAAVGLGVAGSAFLGDLINVGPESLFWGGLCISVPAWTLCIVLLRLAEKPFQTTARANTGLQHPLELPAGITAGRASLAT